MTEKQRNKLERLIEAYTDASCHRHYVEDQATTQGQVDAAKSECQAAKGRLNCYLNKMTRKDD